MQLEPSDIVCCGFGRGTLVQTERGKIPVEQLVRGDLVVTNAGRHRPVRGLAKGQARDGRAILIPAGAIADGKPQRDLLVSPDHHVCLKIVTDCLVPVRYLSQRATFQQKEVGEEAFWQIELDEDDIILPENLAVPSGPDTDPAIDRMTDRRFLETICMILNKRAGLLGWWLDGAPPLDLHVIADGERIDPTADGLDHRFVLEATANDVWLMSENSIPNDVGFNADVRVLGACLASMRITDGLKVAREIALADPLLTTGFHGCEPTIRWTDGCAHLSPRFWSDCNGVFFLSVRLASTALPRYRPPSTAPDAPLK